jgi:hypothetical protein
MKNITHVAIDDAKRKLVLAILRPDAQEPESREIPNEGTSLRRLLTR